MRAILGLVPLAKGEIRVAGRPARRGNPAIGYLPQTRSAGSDLRIREDVWERLSYADLDTNQVSVDVEEGIVKLSGTVEDRRTKHLLEDISAHTAGVSGVDNQICVEKIPSSQMNLGTPYYSLASCGTDPSASV